MKVIKISEEKFKMVDGNNEVEFGLLIKKDGSVNDSLLLPENSLGRKWLNLNKFKDCNEVELREIQRSPSENHKKNWAEYMTDAERETIENIRKNCEKRMEDEKKKS